MTNGIPLRDALLFVEPRQRKIWSYHADFHYPVSAIAKELRTSEEEVKRAITLIWSMTA